LIEMAPLARGGASLSDDKLIDFTRMQRLSW
jgi:hypothetical protein